MRRKERKEVNLILANLLGDAGAIW